MAKLEAIDSTNSFRDMMASVSPSIRDEIAALNAWLEIAWTTFKRKNQRKIQPMRSRYAPAMALQQDMPFSRNHLQGIINLHKQESLLIAPHLLSFRQKLLKFNKYSDNAAKFGRLAMEESILEDLANEQIPIARADCRDFIHDLSSQITSSIDECLKQYNGYASLLSSALLTIMELWTAMDKCAIGECHKVHPIGVLTCFSCFPHPQALQTDLPA